MLAILVAAFLVATPSFACETEFDGDTKIYDPLSTSPRDLEFLQMAERMGIQLTSSATQKNDTVCYDELGCFDKKGTFKHLRQLPESPEKVNTKFLLYTRKNPENPQFLDYKKPETIVNSNMNPNSSIKIIAPGFGGGEGNLTWLDELISAFLKVDDANVIVIDWSSGSRKPYYITASVNSELIGAQTAVLYYTIKEKLGIMEKDLHLLGYSLGAHLIGFIGKRMQILRGTKPGRITGFDPASLLFEDYDGKVYLYKDDGEFVDVIHTNADRLIYGGIGMEKATGHADFYPNGGKRQPGCKSTIKGAILDIIKGYEQRDCNHERSIHLFTDSMLHPDSCQYVGYPCSNYSDFQLGKCLSCDASTCGQLGYQSKGSGVYYLMTKPEKPFCVDVGKLTVRYQSTIMKSYGSIILTLVGENGDKENITLSQKDEKLSPGTEKVVVLPINNVLKPLSKVTALYVRYNGWFTKGTETFVLASVTILDSERNFIFRSCGQDIILKHKESQDIKETESIC